MPTSTAALSPYQRAVVSSLMSLRFGTPTKPDSRPQPDIRSLDDGPEQDAEATSSLAVYRDVFGPTYAQAPNRKSLT